MFREIKGKYEVEDKIREGDGEKVCYFLLFGKEILKEIWVVKSVKFG